MKMIEIDRGLYIQQDGNYSITAGDMHYKGTVIERQGDELIVRAGTEFNARVHLSQVMPYGMVEEKPKPFLERRIDVRTIDKIVGIDNGFQGS